MTPRVTVSQLSVVVGSHTGRVFVISLFDVGGGRGVSLLISALNFVMGKTGLVLVTLQGAPMPPFPTNTNLTWIHEGSRVHVLAGTP